MNTGTNNKKSTTPLIAGTLGGAVSTVLLYPLDLIKVRLQVNESSLSSTSNLDPNHEQQQQRNKMRKSGIGGGGNNVTVVQMIRGVIRHEGVVGLYNGITPAVVGSAVSWGGYFFIYEGVKNKLKQQKKKNDNGDVVNLGPMENFSAACVSGAIMVGCTNPIWLIKTRMQLQMKLSPKEQSKGVVGGTIKPPYKNIVDAARTIVKEEGFKGLYKGSMAALMLVSHGGVQFVCYEFLKGHFGVYQKLSRSDPKKVTSSGISSDSSDNTSLFTRLEDSLGYLIMGAVSKIVATTATYPIQVVKSRLQQRSERAELTSTGEIKVVKRQYLGVIDCVKRIWIHEGLNGFFKGCLPNAIRVAPSAAITFVVYESVVDMMS